MSWSVEKARELYRTSQWSEGYFGVNDQGQAVVSLDQPVALNAIMTQLHAMGITSPVVLRFEDIFYSQVKRLISAFHEAIDEHGYQSPYRGVYPLKVNQLACLKDTLATLRQEDTYYGLEAGSKAELLIALASATDKQALTVVNGYKDREYIELAIGAMAKQPNLILVIDTVDEVQLVIDTATKMGVTPKLGFRTKIMASSCGYWETSSGANSKFGLTVQQVLQAIDNLRASGLEQGVELLHFHVGSQLPTLSAKADALREAAYLYGGLVAKGIPLNYLDIGGGLAVNYDGSNSAGNNSREYTIEQYADLVVSTLQCAFDAQEVAHPVIISESGRAVAAYHSCIITDLIRDLTTPYAMADTDVDLLADFRSGKVSLDELANAETATKHHPNAIKKYLINLSVFQSLADTWALGQVFPIMPITRLDEEPTVRCQLADITCDSDGKVEKFIGQEGDDHYLRIHEMTEVYKPTVGIFLTGAYQDVMGDHHNLFGKLPEVTITAADNESGFVIKSIKAGQSPAEMLVATNYEPLDLFDQFYHQGHDKDTWKQYKQVLTMSTYLT